jgi:hypothetical protein
MKAIEKMTILCAPSSGFWPGTDEKKPAIACRSGLAFFA